MKSLSHVAIIMDGNGRWALQKNKSRSKGHLQGTMNIEGIVKKCIALKLDYLTLFAFGADNWKRPKKEIKYLFYLIEKIMVEKINIFLKQNIKIKFIGEIKKLSSKLKKNLKKIENLSKQNTGMNLYVALNYSSKQEIVGAVNKIIKLKKKKINQKIFNKYLYTNNVPDPEILIRTGGNCRLSNFLLWQCSYTEFFFIKKMWPEFNSIDLSKVIKKYNQIKRNFGNI